MIGVRRLIKVVCRSNIGNAYTAGMGKDLNISSAQYQWLLTIYYIPYIVSVSSRYSNVERLRRQEGRSVTLGANSYSNRSVSSPPTWASFLG